MKNFIYLILIFFTGASFLSSCIDDTAPEDEYGTGSNIVQFENYSVNFSGLADGSEYDREMYVKLTGPDLDNVSGDVTVTFAPDASSTAVENVHYALETSTLTLSADNNYLGVVDIVMLSEGNAPPLDGTPEFDAYVAPVLNLSVANVSGASNVTATGKLASITLNFTPENPYAGDYSAWIQYRHPDGGVYPDNVVSDEVNVKTLTALTGRKTELTWFAVWEGFQSELTVNADNSISYVVGPDWTQTVKIGDPFDATKISHYDPETGVIYLYYHYDHSNGTGIRVFWEVFTPLFEIE